MFDLIERYNFTNIDVLSIGGGYCLEEREFEKYNNNITVVDIDETGNLFQILPNLKLGHSRYFLADYSRFGLKKKFNLVYFSGFTPDELRRKAVSVIQYNKNMEKIDSDSYSPSGWPVHISPFHPLIHKSAKNLKKNGRMIIQSYSNGVDPYQNKTFLKAAQRAFEDMGLIMEEVYSLIESPAVLLYVAKKKRAQPPSGKILEKFHGRAEISNQCTQVYWVGTQQ